MKANQAYKADEEAVSPVVGVILMVAITVVLAAVVFVLVNNLGKGTEKAPSLGASADSTNQRINIGTAEPGHNWLEFDLKADQALKFDLNGDATAADTQAITAGGSTDAGLVGEAVTGGDYFDFCGDGGIRTNVVVQVIHVATNTEVYKTTFPTIAACV